MREKASVKRRRSLELRPSSHYAAAHGVFMVSRFVLFAPIALLAACSDHNPLPAQQVQFEAPAARNFPPPEPASWSGKDEVVFGEVLRLDPIVEGAVRSNGEGLGGAACVSVAPVLEVYLAVERSTLPPLAGEVIAIRLSTFLHLNPEFSVDDAGELTWTDTPFGTAGEPLEVGKQLGIRLAARHPDGFWVVNGGLFTENDDLIEFQEGLLPWTLAYTDEPLTPETFWRDITAVRGGIDPEFQALVDAAAAANPPEPWAMWTPICYAWTAEPASN